jgi:hypothetical protein
MHKDVFIDKSNVTLTSMGDSEIKGQVTISAALQVVIEDVNITGRGAGVLATNNAEVTLENAMVVNNEAEGVIARHGALVVLRNTTISGNATYALTVTDGANARIEDNNILTSDNGITFAGSTIGVFRGATVRIVGFGTVITNTTSLVPPGFSCDFNVGRGIAIDVTHLAWLRQDEGNATVNGHVYIFNLSSVEFRDVDITGAVFVDHLFATLRLRDQRRVPGNVTVTGRICFSGNDNLINIRGMNRPADGTTIRGELNCNGAPFFAPGLPTFLSDPGPGSTARCSINLDVRRRY